MNFQQLRSVREATRQGFNLTDVAEALRTSQPGVSRQIRELEEELGIEIFVRAGKRLVGLTPPGEALLPLVERLLLEAENMRRVGQEFKASKEGKLTVAATHSQARYALPQVVLEFRAQYPKVAFHLHQGSPRQVADMLLSGEADIGVATEALAGFDGLVTLECYRWTHGVVLPVGHPLLSAPGPLTLETLAAYPIITYDVGFTGRSHLDDAFARAHISPDIVLTAMDADVIKTYVELGMGVGIVAAIAFDPERDRHLRMIDARHLFQMNTTRLALRQGTWLRGYIYDFVELFVPTLTRDVIERAMANTGPEPWGEHI